MSGFTPLRRTDGYLPIEDHGLIGDGATAALVGRDGAISWLCLPRFDSPPVFCGLLDAKKGGAFRVAPEEVVESQQRYEDDTGVLVTEMRSRSGLVRVTDALPLRSGAELAEDVPADRRELLRWVQVLDGTVRLSVDVQPWRGMRVEPGGGGLRLHCESCPDLDLGLLASVPLAGPRTVLDLAAGDQLTLLLRWAPGSARHQPVSPEERLQATCDAWWRWMDHVDYEGPRKELVRRSAITLKLLHHFDNGAIVAAPTSSLPEIVGGVRNWDYRFSWIRDAAFSVYALQQIDLEEEASGFLGWVLNAIERGGRPRVLYDLDGGTPAAEILVPELEGYRRSRPVRWGNAAADQIQHDVYGEVLDCIYQWARHHGELDAVLWGRVRELVEAAGREWNVPDQGIWEVRTLGRPFTYSAALCQVALDRGARLAERYGLQGPVKEWQRMSEHIRQAILEEAWDPEMESLTEHLGGGGLDASLLALPLRRVVPADHPRMIATTRAVVDRLGAGNGLLYRYLHEESPDGLPGREGAFLLCSFWLVDNLALQGRLDEAMDLYDSLCDRANPLGLLPEQIDPGSGAFLGNFPQGFSHVGLISSGVNLARALEGKKPEPGATQSSALTVADPGEEL
jgi:GH15 family glucan-1,4-alpha-glucosidase